MRMSIDRGNSGDTILHSIFQPIERNFTFFVAGIHATTLPFFQENFGDTYGMDDFNKLLNRKLDQNGNIKGNMHSFPPYTTQCQMLTITAYDYLLASKYNKKINNLEIVKFLKYLRHGAAHGNKFNISPPIKNDIVWRDKIINQHLNKKEVFHKFIKINEVFLLLADISEELYKLDNGRY